MNRALSEMLHCPNAANCADTTVLERQRSRSVNGRRYFDGTDLSGLFSVPNQEQNSYFQSLMCGGDSILGEAANRPVKPDPGSENGWPELGKFEIPIPSSDFGSSGFGFDANSAISRTASCPPAVAAKMLPVVATESVKKRKAQNTKVAEQEMKEKTLKGCSENVETCTDSGKNNSKASEVETQKLDYIHVRARRGQATDSHSLAERVRREKISERMKYLQDLVPGCSKITGKATMLDEIINYVESLQRQVEFLSMKLATMDPRMDFDTRRVFPIEMAPSAAPNFSTIGMSSEMGHQAYLQQVCDIEMGVSSSEMALRRTISAPVSLPDPFMASSCYTQIQTSSNWNSDLQNVYNIEFHQGRPTCFQPQQFTGYLDVSDLKMEM